MTCWESPVSSADRVETAFAGRLVSGHRAVHPLREPLSGAAAPAQGNPSEGRLSERYENHAQGGEGYPHELLSNHSFVQ
jgi:hypothetical protein